MSPFRLFSRKAAAMPQFPAVSNRKHALFEDTKDTEFIIHYSPSLLAKAWTKYRRLSLILQIFGLTFGVAFLTYSARTIFTYVTLSYVAIHYGDKVQDHTLCLEKAVLDRPTYIAAKPAGSKVLSPRDWIVKCSSSIPGHDCALAYDEAGRDTHWQSSNNIPAGGHSILIDLNTIFNVASLAVKPQKNWMAGGTPYRHRVEVRTAKEEWTTVAVGTWRNYTNEVFATFEPRPAQYVRLTAINTAKDTSFAAIGDINIWHVDQVPAPAAKGGKWNITLNFPIVPVTAFVNPRTQEVTVLSSYMPDGFSSSADHKFTYAATWFPKTGLITEEQLRQTEHDMFCPGTSYDENGQFLVTGGSSPWGFSIYDPVLRKWYRPNEAGTNNPSKFNKPRGYAGQTFLPNGKTFMIGGAWGVANDKESPNKDGEVYDPVTGTWEVLEEVKASSMKMDEVPECTEKTNPTCRQNKTEWQQHHPWLFAWKNGSIFHAGPSKRMNWYYTAPKQGATIFAGHRQDSTTRVPDSDAVCGVAAMYDAEAGLILTAGGAPNYHYWYDDTERAKNGLHRLEATRNVFEIKLGTHGEKVATKNRRSMNHQRIFSSGVVLPNGEILVVGGQRRGEPFWEPTWQPIPEIYTPKTDTWKEVARHSTPRVYHSWALLLPNATVLVGGGGLDDSEKKDVNRFDAQIYEPPYLFAADGVTRTKQPEIKTVDRKVYKISETITITTNVAVNAGSLIRYNAATHTVNNDQRRITLSLQSVRGQDKTYTVKIPDDSGVALPGFWMLFVLADGVPSEAATVQILAK